MSLSEVWRSAVVVSSDSVFEASVEELDVAFGEGVCTRGLVVAGTPEGRFFFVEWWKLGVKAELAGKSLLGFFDPFVIWFVVRDAEFGS